MLTRNQICSDTTEFSESRAVTFLNPYSILKIMESKTDLDRFDKVCIDGIALKIFLDLVFFRSPKIQRMSFDFTSVANLVFEKAATENENVFVLGSDENSNNKFVAEISRSFPGIKMDGRSGYFADKNEMSNELSALASSNYDYIVIGMGAVKQEEVAIALMDAGFKGRIYTCGGFIHQTAQSGGVYYPEWVDKYNLRFLYRMLKEPSTIKRYLVDYPKSFYLLTRTVRNFKYS